MDNFTICSSFQLLRVQELRELEKKKNDKKWLGEFLLVLFQIAFPQTKKHTED